MPTGSARVDSRSNSNCPNNFLSSPVFSSCPTRAPHYGMSPDNADAAAFMAQQTNVAATLLRAMNRKQTVTLRCMPLINCTALGYAHY